MQWLKRLIVLVLAVGLSACAVSGQKFSEATPAGATPAAGTKSTALDPENGRIYFYRTMLLGAAVQPEVLVNGQVVGRATPNGFFFVDRKPGSYEVTTTTEVELKLTLTLDKGQTRFVKLNLGMGFFVGHVYPELMDNDVGQKEIADTRFTGN